MLFHWLLGRRSTAGRQCRACAGAYGTSCAPRFLTNLLCGACACPAGCLKNVLVVWGGILQGDVVTPRELQARPSAALCFHTLMHLLACDLPSEQKSAGWHCAWREGQ